MESYRETWIKERPPEMESHRERNSGENPRDGVTGRQRRERRLRGDSTGSHLGGSRFPRRQFQGDTDKGRYSSRGSHRETRREKRPLETESQGMGMNPQIERGSQSQKEKP